MSMMNKTCTVLSRTAGTATDVYGNPTYGTTSVSVPCEIQAAGGRAGAGARREPGEEGELSITDWIAFFPSGTVIDTSDQVSEASLGTFEVIGDPWDANSGSAAVNHVEANLRKTS
jgi:hypothetical protein